MIKLPNAADAFTHENNFYWASNVNRIAKVLTHYELFKMTIDLPGAIVECGVFKGASLIRLATFRHLFGNAHGKKIVGFDAFGAFPETDYSADKVQREVFISDSGEEGIGPDQLMSVLELKGIATNVDLVQGDVRNTIPTYLEKFPELRISLLNVDVDVYEATKSVLDHLYDRVVRGGVVMLDDYVDTFPGANDAVEGFFADKNVNIKRMPFAVTPCYVVKP